LCNSGQGQQGQTGQQQQQQQQVLICAALALSRLALSGSSGALGFVAGTSVLDALSQVQALLGAGAPGYLRTPMAEAIRVLTMELGE
jgi:hypothetical protein